MAELPPGVTPVEPESPTLPPGVTPVPSPKGEGLGMGLLAAKGLPYIGAPLGVLTTPGGMQAAKDTARTTIPMAVGAATGGAHPILQSLAQGGTAYAMQQTGLEKPSWFQVMLAAGLPLVPPLAGRLWRGGERTATRIMPSRFEAAQGAAKEAGEKMVAGLRPEASASQLYEAAEQAASGAGRNIAIPEAMRAIDKVRKLPVTIDSSLKPFEDAATNIRQLAPSGRIEYRDLDELRKQIQPYLGNDRVRNLYGAIIRDLERTAVSDPSAALAREAAKAYKADLGANLLHDLITKSSPSRMISGGNVPALNVAKLNTLVNADKTNAELARLLGPGGMEQIKDFIFTYRNLPPDVAFNAANRLISVLAGGAGGGIGAAIGGAIGNLPGALIGGAVGAVGPEFTTNVIKAGANPPLVNKALNALLSGARAGGFAQSGDVVEQAQRGRR